MSDEPFYAPNRKPDPPRASVPGQDVWWLHHPDGRLLRCVLRDDSAAGAGFDVQLLDSAGDLLYAKRCVDRAGAEFVAKMESSSEIATPPESRQHFDVWQFATTDRS